MTSKLTENRTMAIHGWPDVANMITVEYTDTSAVSGALDLHTCYMVRASSACFLNSGLFVDGGESPDAPIATTDHWPLLPGDMFIFTPKANGMSLAAVRDTESGTLYICPLLGVHVQ